MNEGFVFKEGFDRFGISLPKTARLLRISMLKVGVAGENPQGPESSVTATDATIFVAMPWSQKSFLSKALTMEHPVDRIQSLEPDTYMNIFLSLTEGHEIMSRRRADTLSYYRRRAVELADDETKLHLSLRPEFEVVLAKKKLLLFKEMLSDIGFRDELLHHRMISGFPITGEMDRTGEFQDKVAMPANISVEELRQTSVWSQQVIKASIKSSGDSEVDLSVYNSTVAEVQAGWAEGPLTPSQLTAQHGPNWIASRRFGVVQGRRSDGSIKIRAVDDVSEFSVNSAVGTSEKISLGGVDACIALGKCMCSCVDDNGNVAVPDGFGGIMAGTLHPSWTISQARQLEGRCVDLQSAYKNLVRCHEDAPFSVIGIWNPHTSSPEFFNAISLMFGATGSVYGFNRPALGIRQILTKLFQLQLTSFFDDYIQAEFSSLRDSAANTIDGLLELLGWDVAVDKQKPFERTFQALGTSIDFSSSEHNLIAVRNTESRIQAITEEVERIKSVGRITQPEASSLKGRLAFSETQHWARCGTMVTMALADIASTPGGSSKLDPEMQLSLSFVTWLMASAHPRYVQPRPVEKCTFIFTDGAAEGNLRQDVTCSAVVFSPRLQKPEFFGMSITANIVSHWSSRGSKQVIGQAEILPVIVAKQTWHAVLAHCRVVWMIDNEAAREGLVKSFSPSWASRELLLYNAFLDVKLCSLSWYARVPSVANAADGPSRNDNSLMEEIGAVYRQPASITFPFVSHEDLLSSLKKTQHVEVGFCRVLVLSKPVLSLLGKSLISSS